LVIRTNQYC